MTLPVRSDRLPALRIASAGEVPEISRRGQPCVLPDASRGMGIFFCATRGAGKSRSLGRGIAWQDFQREIPLVIFDPVGGTIDNLLEKIGRQPLAVRRELWKRVPYINMNGQNGRVVPWPIYYQAQTDERLSVMSQRYVDVIARVDPELRRNPKLGMNALAPLAQATGIVLSALGLGITETWSLIDEPEVWKDRLLELAEQRPETTVAVRDILALQKLGPRELDFVAGSLRSKLTVFRYAENFRAIFGATRPGINWRDVLEQRQAVLIDFQDVESPEMKKFCLLWVYHSLLTFIKDRGHCRTRPPDNSIDDDELPPPISFIIDELSYLVGSAAVNADLLTGDIDELINRIARSHGIWLTLATQELFQLPSQIRQTVLSMGTVIFGQTSDDLAAEELARRYFPYDPYKVKKSRTVYGSATP